MISFSGVLRVEWLPDGVYIIDESTNPPQKYEIPEDPSDPRYVELLLMIYTAGFNVGSEVSQQKAKGGLV